MGTGDAGRILLVDAGGRSGLFTDTTSRQVHALAAGEGRLAAALSNVAALLLSAGERAGSGTLVSEPHDAGRASLWGRVRVMGRVPEGAGLSLELLRFAGFEAEMVTAPCCGMAGAFGFELIFEKSP